MAHNTHATHHAPKRKEQPARRFETLPEGDTGRAVAGDELRLPILYAHRVPASVDPNAPSVPVCIVCADGTRRSVKHSPFRAAADYAHVAAEGEGLASNFPTELRALADAPKDGLRRMDIVAVADARKKLGIYAKAVAMDEGERAELRKARRARRIERGEA